jgi:hypothetical protein
VLQYFFIGYKKRYCAGDEWRRMNTAGHVARMEEWRGAYKVLVVKREGKRPLWWPRRRWEGNIKADLQEVGVGVLIDWSGSG